MKILLIAAVTLFAFPVQAAAWLGAAHVVDGGTLVVQDTELRLFAVHAPQLEQTCRTRKGQTQKCGQLARQALAATVRGVDVRCEDKGLDAQGRRVAVCFAGWMDLAEEMTASGWALADPIIGGAYKRSETFAKARREGLWRSEFTAPWEWHEK